MRDWPCPRWTLLLPRLLGSEGTFTREVDLSNLPDFDNDHRVSGGAGIKFAPRDFFVFIANVLVPLNDGGLRPDAIATLGFEFNF